MERELYEVMDWAAVEEIVYSEAETRMPFWDRIRQTREFSCRHFSRDGRAQRWYTERPKFPWNRSMRAAFLPV